MRKSFLLVFLILFAGKAFSQENTQPKLIVGIVVDQMCYEYLYRYYDKFGSDGFKKLMEKGAHCRNTHYNYVPTFTGPGHASIYTGTTPNNHGIVANDWYDRDKSTVINCVEDLTVSPIGTTADDGLCSPQNLKTFTVTDQLKLTYPSSKVISMSIKDRGAILPGGHLSNGSYWYDYSSGKFITSSFYSAELPKWVEEFNSEKNAANVMSDTWNTLYAIENYSESGPDDSHYEQLLPTKSTPTFPYDLKEIGTKMNPYQLFTITPFANTYLADFALKAIASEQLGQGTETDMLCVSFSTPDIAGHSFGPYSVEIEDIYLRLDLEIAKIIDQLEQQVGKKNFIMFLTADHAVVPVPQFLIDQKLPGGYFFLDEVMSSVRDKSVLKFGIDPIIMEDNLNVYLNYQLIDSIGYDSEIVAQFIANELSKYDEIKAVYTRQQLMTGAENEWREMLLKGFHPKESGDVLFILEPGYLPKSIDSETARRGTSHGSAFNYDTHVPLLWYGSGIPKIELHRKINITDIAATLVQMMNLQRNGAMTGDPILELLTTKKRK